MAERIIEKALIEVLNMNLTASVVILAVLVIRLFLKRAPRVYSYALWAVVLFRLLCPVSFMAPLSLLGVLQNEAGTGGRMEYISEHIGFEAQPQAALPIPGVSDPLNELLPEANPSGSVNPMQLILWAAGYVWILGIAALLVYSLVSLLRLKRKLKTAVQDEKGIYRFHGKGSAFVLGIFRPRIYLPDSLSEQEERYILLHENIHIKRKDPLIRALSWLALTLHWFNPLVWAAFHFSGQDMEMSCDEAVIRQMGDSVKKNYCASLLAMATGERAFRGIPLAFGESGTGGRIRNVLGYRRPKRILAAIIGVVCVILAVWLAANPAEPSGPVYYGIVQESDMGDGSLVVEIPGSGGVRIPDAETVVPYIETEFDGLEAGDLVRITFPKGIELYIQETYPGSFTEDAERIEVMARGSFRLEYQGGDVYLLMLPLGLAPEAEKGDTLEIKYSGELGQGSLAPAPVLSVDETAGSFFTALSTEDTETFLEKFGFGLTISVLPLDQEEVQQEEQAAREEKPEALTKEMLLAGIPDGEYQLYIRSLSRSLEAVDLYVVDGWDMETDGVPPSLAFVDYCAYLVNQEMNGVRYEAVTFDAFADAVEGGLTRMNVPCVVTMQDGQITRAVLDSSWYGYGISYEPFYEDTGYGDLQESLGMTGEEMLETYFTLADTVQADFGEGRGTETAEIWTGNAGDGDSGFVLLKDRDGGLLYALSAHTARAGWNNIYLGEAEGTSFLMTVHVEDRDTYGEYSYQVFRLGAYGQILQMAGSSREFGEAVASPDEALLEEWNGELEDYLEHSQLLLSTQDGEVQGALTLNELR